jgi:glycosyltransferase involved in cell wall biosynthesis
LLYVDATRSSYLPWLFWGAAEKLARVVYPLMPGSVLLNALAGSRRSFQIISKVKNISPRPDLITAHNLGALYPAWRLSKKWKVPFIFDVEDYHPGEFIRFDAINEKHRREFLMKKLLPDASAITSASPLIGEFTMKLIESHPKHQVILNSFPQAEFTEPAKGDIIDPDTPLRLVWFSQKISFGRGLEQLFEALKLMEIEVSSGKIPFSLALIGDLDQAFEEIVISLFRKSLIGSCLTILPPMKQDDLHQSLANYDVGLALEPGKDLNNLLAVSNKIIAYAQAGLYILATDTPAQRQFIQELDDCGLLCGQTPEAIRDGLLAMIHGGNDISGNRHRRYKSASDFAWEEESLKVSDLLNTVLTNE